jgi:hypothetical protein
MTDEPVAITEADERFAARLAEDLGRILGTGIVIDELLLGPSEDTPTKIRALCLFDGGMEVLEVGGETRLDAYNRLVLAAAELRLSVAARRMIAPL